MDSRGRKYLSRVPVSSSVSSLRSGTLYSEVRVDIKFLANGHWLGILSGRIESQICPVSDVPDLRRKQSEAMSGQSKNTVCVPVLWLRVA
jgi:hypothetical protein